MPRALMNRSVMKMDEKRRKIIGYVVSATLGLAIGVGVYFMVCRLKFDSNGKPNVAYEKRIIYKWPEQKTPEGVIPLYDPPKDEDKDEFIKERNYESFSNLSIRYIYADVEIEAVLYALIAANKFNIAQANYYVYHYLTHVDHVKAFYDPIMIDERTRNVALHYLRRGALLNDSQAKTELESLKIKEK